jgi:hypothetical protein
MYCGRPLVKEGGIVVAYNPGREVFHPGHHPSYLDFWEKDLAAFYEPEACWEALADAYAENPDYIHKYQTQYAYHGTHSLINWVWSGMALKHVQAVILAGARNPAAAKKIGFIPSADFQTALAMAREMAGNAPTMAYQFVPPLFCMDMSEE